ncbi:uncharacterized protein EKO05_0010113 [Ascochyta rabiei]|uniref:uncharacterized protein n=1 Tax=Didymella rabiei TaxID=5454 RepID=UPI00220FE7C8|nr:uncharacterized protein EKO05_0010113 [Ascochyta rabiei]UPX19862.1 hypothetical protein EKO05_0010113 [Ascochyta rabiei]
MAPQKRKRQPTRTTSNKRLKYTQRETDSSSSSSSSDDNEELTNDSQVEWEALRILAQKGRGFGLKYLIEWKGVDPATGEQWEPTWEAARNASDSLSASWKREQALQLYEKKEAAATTTSSTQHQSATEILQAQATQTRATRQRRIVESPETSTSAPATELPTNNSPNILASPSTAVIGIEVPLPDWTSNPRGDSLNPGEYEPHAEIPESPPSPARSNSNNLDLDSSQLFASQRAFRASGVVPDTQSSVGDASYISVTQEELDSSLHSNSADESTEGNIVGHSGFLDTNTDAALRLDASAQSPATSIAETVADTTQDLQSQPQVESQQERSEIPETLGSPAGSTKPDQPSNPTKEHYTATTSAHLQSLGDQHELCSSEQLAFIENTTQCDHEISSHNIQITLQEQGAQIPPTEASRELGDTIEQPTVSLAESVTLVVADTPQISQLPSTAQDSASQTNIEHQSEAAQQTVEEGPSLLFTEHSVLEEYGQFPFHSQRPAFSELESATKSTQRALTEPLRTHVTHVVTGAQLSEGLNSNANHDGGTSYESQESTTIDEISQPTLLQESNRLPRKASRAQLSQSQADARNSDHVPFGVTEENANQANPTIVSWLPPSIEYSTGSREHNAQLIPSGEDLSTQDDATKSIQATTEHETEASPKQKGSPCSRHDSSQETPERHLRSVDHSSSPIRRPPSCSLRTLDSNVPSRPPTPTLSSLLSRMTESTGARVERQLKEYQEADRAANPFVPRRERIRAYQPSSSVTSADAATTGSLPQSITAPAPPAPPVPPKINVLAEGTRSPSTVPDHSPAPPAQTSLRAVAFTNAKDRATDALLNNSLAATSLSADAGPTQEKAELVAAAAAVGIPNRPAVSPEPLADESTEEMSDVGDNADDYDYETMWNDDLQLERGEYIVPLFIEGRQSDTYSEYIKQKSDLLDVIFYTDLTTIKPEALDTVEEALVYMKAVETHPDLTYAEAESATGFDMQSAADTSHAAQFGIENSVKFKFLNELFNSLRDQNLHVVLLLDQDNDALFGILRTFFTATSHSFSMPTKGYKSNTSNDDLTITVFPNTASPILRPANLIICLDGVQSAAQIRQSNWAVASSKTVPIIHLVIPQTVGHIERYFLPSIERKTRIEATVAGLSQIQKSNKIGKPVDLDTPTAAEAARLISFWLISDDEQEITEWPLPSIGSVRKFLEYEQTQQSVQPATSPPAPERTKRSLEAGDSDTAKRMRYTPQPRVIPGSGVNQENEATRISDSMPGTAFSENPHLSTRLEEARSELFRIEKEHREKEFMWDKQQTEHENRAQDYRKLLIEKGKVDHAYDSRTKELDKLRTQLEAKTAEIKTLRDELEAQRALGLNSHDEKDVAITQLRKELEIAQLDRDRALRSVKSTEVTLEYTTEQYRTVSNTASQLRTEVTSLQTENAKLAHQSSGEAAKLKQLHLNKSTKNLIQQNKALMSENSRMKVTLKQKEDELIRAKSNSMRMGYGTRAQSTTPQPKTRSRATSPTATRGGRGGRIGDLRLEER